MCLYYIYFKKSNSIKYLEVEKKLNKKELKELLKDIKEEIEVYKNCSNCGLFDPFTKIFLSFKTPLFKPFKMYLFFYRVFYRGYF